MASPTRRHPPSPLILTPIDVKSLDAKFSSLADQWDTISQCSNRPRVVDNRSASYLSDDDDDNDSGRETTKRAAAWFVSFDNDNAGGDDLPNNPYDDKADDWDDESLTTAATSVAGDYQVDYTGWNEEVEPAASSLVKREEDECDHMKEKDRKDSLEEQKLNDQRIVEEMESESVAIEGDLVGVGEEEDEQEVEEEGMDIVDEEKPNTLGHYCFNEELWMVKTTPEMERLAQKMKEQDRRPSRDSSLETTEHMTSSDDSESEKETMIVTTINVVDKDENERMKEQQDQEILKAKVKEAEHQEEVVTLLTKELSRDDDEPALDLLEDDIVPQDTGSSASENRKEGVRVDMETEESSKILLEEGDDILEQPEEELVASSEKNDDERAKDDTMGTTEMVSSDEDDDDDDELDGLLDELLDAGELSELFHDAAITIQYWWLDLAIKQALRQSRQIDLDIDQALHASMQPEDFATILQSFCRMVLAKRVLQGLKDEKGKELCATRIQAFCRMIIAQRTRHSLQVEKLEVLSAIKVQALYRMVKAKRVCQSIEDEKLKLASATKLQSMCRMVTARKIRQSLEADQVEVIAATKIQSRCRAIMAKKTGESLKNEKLKRLSATKIQSFYRFFMAQRTCNLLQKERQKILTCTTECNDLCRRVSQEGTTKKNEIRNASGHAATIIQSVWRMTVTKKQSQRHIQQKQFCLAAMKIQHFVRHAFDTQSVSEDHLRKRKQQEQQYIAALKLQCFARMALAKTIVSKQESIRSDQLKQLNAAVKLQSFARGTLVKVRTLQTNGRAISKQDPQPVSKLVNWGEEGADPSIGEEDTQDVTHVSKTGLKTTHPALLERSSDASPLSERETKVFFGMQKLALGPGSGPDVDCLSSENSDNDITDAFLAEIEGLQSELDSIYSKQPNSQMGDDGDSWDSFEDAQGAPLSPRSEDNEGPGRVHIEQLEMIGREKDQQEDDRGNSQTDTKLPPTSIPTDSNASSTGNIAPGDFPLLGSNWFDKYKDDCLWDEESVISANTTASAPAQTASCWDDESVSSTHTAATAPVPRDLVVSVYTQRAKQFTEEEIYTGAMNAVALAKEIESLMANAKKRRPRRKRQQMGFFRGRRRTNEIQKKTKQTVGKSKVERRRQTEPVKATDKANPQPRAGIRGRLSRMFRRGKENPPGTRSETNGEVKRKQGIQCRAETLLTE